MATQRILTVTENRQLNYDVWRMTLEGDCTAISAPGQFINLKLDGLYLRRPISVFDWTENSVTIVYKVVGKGTEQMTGIAMGEKIDTLLGLGNGFTAIPENEHPVLIGGGVGVPPLYGLAKDMLKKGMKPAAILGFNTAKDIILAEDFRALGIDVHIATANGEVGVKGFVTDVLKDLSCDYFYSCGPIPMLKAICSTTQADGQMSFEERMGCGFGACMGCTIHTKDGYKRVCKDGPVLVREEIVW